MSCDLTDDDLTRIYNQANGIADGQHVPITTERIFAAMRASMASANQLADYAWQNARTIEKARQGEMAKRDELLATLEYLKLHKLWINSHAKAVIESTIIKAQS
jgi:hypothetical protein